VRLPDGTRTTIPLPEKGSLLIGRSAPADLVLADQFLSRSHLRFECNSGVIRFTDPESRNGTWVNGVRSRERLISHGDCLHAGHTFFRLSAVLEGKVILPLLAAVPEEPLSPEQVLLVDAIQATCSYAILDGAVDKAVCNLLKRSGALFHSLYEGEPAIPIAPFGPFLVDFKSVPHLLPHVIQSGWTKAWGVFLKTSAGFEEVRHHLRSLLIVKTEDGRDLLFRFYDPRVLPPFLATCTASERAQLFGCIEGWVVAADTGQAMLLSPSGETRALLPLA